MKKFKYFLPTVCEVIILSAVLGLILPPPSYGKKSAAPPVAEDDSPGRGDEHRADPCEHLPDPPGKAKGHDKKCPPEGSSAGVARGDFNGDGFADLAVGVPDEDIGNVQDAGAVHVIYGSVNGLTEGGGSTGVPAPQVWHQNTTSPGIVLDSAEAFDRFGSALAAGDFNGDDFSDLAIGVPGEDIDDYSGAVNVLYGSANGLTAEDDQLWKFTDFFTSTLGLSEPDIPPTDTDFGTSLAWGDFNGDTIGDLAVGVPGAGVVCGIFCEPSDTGRVLILYGSSPGGLSISGAQQVMQSGAGGFGILVGDSIEENDQFGKILAAGDFDNDTFDDLVIGVPREDVDFSNNVGMVHIAFGSEDGISTRFMLFRQGGGACGQSPGVCIPGDPASGEQLGRALAVGDLDGDDLADLAVGTPFENVGSKTEAGVVYVLYGSRISSGLPASVQSAQTWHQDIPGIQDGPANGDHFGLALAAGDFNADGFADLAVGVPDEDFEDSTEVGEVVRTNAGAVHIIYGTSSGLNEAGDQFFAQSILGTGRLQEAGDRFGASLTAWNFGRNNIRRVCSTPTLCINFPVPTADLAIGIPGEDLFNAQGVNLADVGAVSVLYGHSTNKLSATGNQLWHQTVPGADTPNSDEAGDQIEAGDGFGTALY